MKLKKGDWVRFISPLFASRFHWGSREGIVVESSNPHMAQVLYIGANRPRWVNVAYLEKIEVENEV